jgi:hypothetical protein
LAAPRVRDLETQQLQEAYAHACARERGECVSFVSFGARQPIGTGPASGA